MDYQHNGWFRPTCGCRTAPQTVRHTAVSEAHHHDTTEELAHIHPTSLAMTWSPIQEWRMLYDPCKALQRGTLFAELDKPFSGKCC